jgi:hypothetical protein
MAVLDKGRKNALFWHAVAGRQLTGDGNVLTETGQGPTVLRVERKAAGY